MNRPYILRISGALHLDVFDQPKEPILRREKSHDHNAEAPRDRWSVELESKLQDAVRQIRYGTATLVIQDGHIVQTDKSENIR